MALFGRHTAADLQRHARLAAWVRARSPLALFGVMFGTLAVLDFFTPLGVVFGLAAIVLGFRGLSDLRRQPQLAGHRLCRISIALGALGLIMSTTFIITMY